MTSESIVLLGSSRSDGETRRAVDIAFEGKATCLDLQTYDFSSYDYDNANREDDFLRIIDLIVPRETIIFATPVYWYAMSARLKTFIDRFSDLITIEKTKGRALAGKTAWLITTGVDEKLPDGFEVSFERTCAYFFMSYRGAEYLHTGRNPQLRIESEIRMREWGFDIIGNNRRGD